MQEDLSQNRFLQAVALDLAERNLRPEQVTLDILQAAMRQRLARDNENALRVRNDAHLVKLLAERSWLATREARS